MGYSKHLEDFLNFLRECQESYNIAVDQESDADIETQDILHYFELQNVEDDEWAKISKMLGAIRRDRRVAKNKVEQLIPIVGWIDENEKVIKSLERLLGDVRKAERNAEGRMYLPRTNVIDRAINTPDAMYTGEIEEETKNDVEVENDMICDMPVEQKSYSA